MPLLLRLFLEFFRTGLFAVGGGLATLPFLYEMSAETGWFTVSDIANLVAVSESTPGPMGVNMATYAGYINSGIIGSIVGPLGLVTPSIIIIIIISQFLKKFKDNKYVQYAFYGLRAASTALILAAGCSIAKLAFLAGNETEISGNFMNCVNWMSVVVCVIVFITFRKYKKHPVLYIVCSAAVGIVCQL